MKIPTRPRGQGLAFNLTPLIDIVFLLVIFFLAASHLVRSEASEAVELPTATQSDDDQKRPQRLTVTIPASAELFVGGRVVSLVDLEHLIGRGGAEAPGMFEVRIRADRRIPYRIVEPIMLACARSGVTRVQFAVLPE